ncbi:MAG: hypothetical protein ACC661_04510 [Verrucomicrobiales bacterium]
MLAAGEAFFDVESEVPSVYRITNQSTGFCPEPSSWEAVSRALSRAGLVFPPGFEPAFEFRRCESCGTIAVVKDDDFTCLVCGEALPVEWNADAASRG